MLRTNSSKELQCFVSFTSTAIPYSNAFVSCFFCSMPWNHIRISPLYWFTANLFGKKGYVVVGGVYWFTARVSSEGKVRNQQHMGSSTFPFNGPHIGWVERHAWAWKNLPPLSQALGLPFLSNQGGKRASVWWSASKWGVVECGLVRYGFSAEYNTSQIVPFPTINGRGLACWLILFHNVYSTLPPFQFIGCLAFLTLSLTGSSYLKNFTIIIHFHCDLV